MTPLLWTNCSSQQDTAAALLLTIERQSESHHIVRVDQMTDCPLWHRRHHRHLHRHHHHRCSIKWSFASTLLTRAERTRSLWSDSWAPLLWCHTCTGQCRVVSPPVNWQSVSPRENNSSQWSAVCCLSADWSIIANFCLIPSSCLRLWCFGVWVCCPVHQRHSIFVCDLLLLLLLFSLPLL